MCLILYTVTFANVEYCCRRTLTLTTRIWPPGAASTSSRPCSTLPTTATSRWSVDEADTDEGGGGVDRVSFVPEISEKVYRRTHKVICIGDLAPNNRERSSHHTYICNVYFPSRSPEGKGDIGMGRTSYTFGGLTITILMLLSNIHF